MLGPCGKLKGRIDAGLFLPRVGAACIIMAVASPCTVEAQGSWLSTVPAAMLVEEADEVGAEVKGYAGRCKAEG